MIDQLEFQAFCKGNGLQKMAKGFSFACRGRALPLASETYCFMFCSQIAPYLNSFKAVPFVFGTKLANAFFDYAWPFSADRCLPFEGKGRFFDQIAQNFLEELEDKKLI